MSKILDATCDNAGKVSVSGVEVPDALVLSEGAQASAGLLFLDEHRKAYLPSSATDIKTTIENLSTSIDNIAQALTTISTALTSIGAGMTGPTTAPPGTLPTDVATIVSKVTAVNAVKVQLDTLKDALK